jgi:hypothetical protein
VKDYRFWTWFARVRKYFVCNKKFRSEISRFRFWEGLEVLKLKGANLKVKLKRFKGVPVDGVPEGGIVFDRFPRVWDY